MVRVGGDSTSLQCDKVLKCAKDFLFICFISTQYIVLQKMYIDLHQIHPSLCLWFHLMSSLVHAQRLKTNHYQGVKNNSGIKIDAQILCREDARVLCKRSRDGGGGRDKTETCSTDSAQSICLQRRYLIAILIKTLNQCAQFFIRAHFFENTSEIRALFKQKYE